MFELGSFFSKMLRRGAKNRLPDSFPLDGYTVVETVLIDKTIRNSVQGLSTKYGKPIDYDRNLLDSASAKIYAKKNAFDTQYCVIDPYTNQNLYLTKNEAKQLYGDQWQHHLAESDHIVPLKKVFDESKESNFLSSADIKEIGNAPSNIRVVSRSFNNAKRSKNNSEFIDSDRLLSKNKISLDSDGKKRAIDDERSARSYIIKQSYLRSASNIAVEANSIGVSGAVDAGFHVAAVAAIDGIVGMFTRDEPLEKALENVARNGGKAALNGYIRSSTTSIATYTLLSSKSLFLKELAKNNVPAKVISAIVLYGDTLAKYANGEMSTKDCMIRIGEIGFHHFTIGQTMMIGQAVIPIPVIGAAIGAFVGSALSSTVYNGLLAALNIKDVEMERRMQVINQCLEAARQARKYREEMEAYLTEYFQDLRSYFDDAYNELAYCFEIGDSDGVIQAANLLTERFGGRVYYNSVEEFKDFLSSDNIDVL